MIPKECVGGRVRDRNYHSDDRTDAGTVDDLGVERDRLGSPDRGIASSDPNSGRANVLCP